MEILLRISSGKAASREPAFGLLLWSSDEETVARSAAMLRDGGEVHRATCLALCVERRGSR